MKKMKTVIPVLFGFLILKLVNCAEQCYKAEVDHYPNESNNSTLFYERRNEDTYTSSQKVGICESGNILNVDSCDVNEISIFPNSATSSKFSNILSIPNTPAVSNISDLQLTEEEREKLSGLSDVENDPNSLLLFLWNKVIRENVLKSEVKFALARFIFKFYDGLGISDRRAVDRENKFLKDFINFLINENQYEMILELLPEEFEPAIQKIKDYDDKIAGFLKCMKNSPREEWYLHLLRDASKYSNFPKGKWAVIALLNDVSPNLISNYGACTDEVKAFADFLILKGVPIAKFDEIRTEIQKYLKKAEAKTKKSNWNYVEGLIEARYSRRVFENLSLVTRLPIQEIEKYCVIDSRDYMKFKSLAERTYQKFNLLEQEFAFYFVEKIHANRCGFRELHNLKECLKMAFKS